MKKLRIIPVLVLMALFFSGSVGNKVFGQGITFTKTLDAAKAKAKSENKLIFVDAYTTWCGPCRWMSSNVFTDAKVGEFFNKNFINIKIDCEKGEGPKFAQTYKVRAYPTMFFLDAEGNIVKQTKGAKPVEDFIEFGKSAL